MNFFNVALLILNCILKNEGTKIIINIDKVLEAKNNSESSTKQYLLDPVKGTSTFKKRRRKRKTAKPKRNQGGSNTTTLHQKIVFGYQGWFCTDKAANLGWTHWSTGTPPSATSANFDLFPDVSDYTASALSNYTLLTNKVTGQHMYLYDSLQVVDVHFSWMEEYGIHGVAVQRFVSQLAVPRLRDRNDQVLIACMRAAEKYSRAFFVEYDTSGADSSTWDDVIQKDWEKLTRVLNVTSSRAYQREGTKPILKIYGIGFLGNPGNASDSLELVQSLKSLGVLFIGSVPTFWRDGKGDSKSGYHEVYQAMDVISPWLVGRFSNPAKFDDMFKGVFLKDLRLTSSRQQGYAPTVFPGFSWKNLQRRRGRDFPLNQIPRHGGKFWEHQVNAYIQNLVDATTGIGAYYLFGAMFDEFDESTAMMKAASNSYDIPLEGTFLHLSIDGEDLPSDHYLRLAGKYSLKFKNFDRTIVIPPSSDRMFFLSTQELIHYQLRAKQIELLRQDSLLS